MAWPDGECFSLKGSELGMRGRMCWDGGLQQAAEEELHVGGGVVQTVWSLECTAAPPSQARLHSSA